MSDPVASAPCPYSPTGDSELDLQRVDARLAFLRRRARRLLVLVFVLLTTLVAFIAFIVLRGKELLS